MKDRYNRRWHFCCVSVIHIIDCGAINILQDERPRHFAPTNRCIRRAENPATHLFTYSSRTVQVMTDI